LGKKKGIQNGSLASRSKIWKDAEVPVSAQEKIFVLYFYC